MGWVEDEFLDHEAYERLTPRLWDAVRDACGAALLEFNARMGSTPIFELRDCTARGAFCLRIQKMAEKPSIEVFLDIKERSVNIALRGGKTPLHVCGYRLSVTRELLEFVDKEGALTADQVCRKALREFMFTPFPMVPKSRL
jgi:hypothetical protein